MKKKILKVMAFIIATVGVIFLLLLYNSFNGNFIAKEVATRHMKDYLKTHHTDLDITDYKVSYNFKNGSYVMYVDVADSVDKDFRLSYRKGLDIQDDYEWMVLEKGNMQNRVAAFLNEERFEKPVLALVKKQDLAYMMLQIKGEGEEHVDPYAKIAIDTPSETIVKTQPIVLRIYVKSEAVQKKYRTEKILEQCKQAYEKLHVHVVEVEICR